MSSGVLPRFAVGVAGVANRRVVREVCEATPRVWVRHPPPPRTPPLPPSPSPSLVAPEPSRRARWGTTTIARSPSSCRYVRFRKGTVERAFAYLSINAISPRCGKFDDEFFYVDVHLSMPSLIYIYIYKSR